MISTACVALALIWGGLVQDKEESQLTTIREYRVQVSGPDQLLEPNSQKLAEIINVFPMQRGGVFHGSLYEYHRNDNFDARNFFDPVGPPLPEYKRNQFGLNLGVALGQRLYIGSSYDGLRILQGSTLLSHIPSAAMRQGDFSELLSGETPIQLRDPLSGHPFSGNRIPSQRIHSVARRLLPLLPDPNRSDRSRNFVNNEPLVQNRDLVNNRVNLEVDEKNKISLAYELGRGTDLRTHPLPAFGSREQQNEHDLSFSYNQIFTENLVARWRFEYSREREFTLPRHERQTGLVSSLGISGISASDTDDEGYPVFGLAGYRSFGDAGTPDGSIRNHLSFESSLTHIRGSHTLQLNAEIGARQLNNHRSPSLERGVFTFSGFYTGDAFADFLLGVPDSASHAVGSSRLDLRSKRWEFDIGDEWKVNSRLTVTAALAYHYSEPYRSLRNNIAFFHPLQFEPPRDGELIAAGGGRAAELASRRAGRRSLVLPDRNDWAPRLGLAFRPFENSRTVIRASYAIFYDPLGSFDYARYTGRNYPFYFTETAHASLRATTLDLSRPFEGATPAELVVHDMDPNFRTPYIQNWQLRVEKELKENWTIEIGYEGDKGTGLSRNLLGNIPLPGAGSIQPRRPNPAFGNFKILSGGGSSIEHDLEISGQRRLADGFSLQFEMDWSRQLNDDFDGEPSNPRNLRAERALDDEPTREFSVSYIFDLPFGPEHRLGSSGPLRRFLEGWRLSGITRIQGGSPFTVLMPGDLNNDGLQADRPDRLGRGNLDSSERNIDRWFETGHFAAPAPLGFGNAGRNILWGPGYHNWDISLVKITHFPNGHRLEFRAELFNAFNQVNFETPAAVWGTRTFGRIFGAERAREIELALKYAF